MIDAGRAVHPPEVSRRGARADARYGTVTHAGAEAATTAFWPVVTLITALGFALRVWHATTSNLWYDEIETVRIATLPFAELVRGMRGTVTLLPTAWLSPLYFLLLRATLALAAWLRPDASIDDVLRLSSVLIGAATIPALAWSARRLVGAEAALVATLLLATSPFHLWYSQEVRPYALLVLVAIVAMGLFDRALAAGDGRAWAAWMLAVIAALYIHPTAAVLPMVCVVAAAARGETGRATLVRGFTALAVIALAFLPGAAVIALRGANEVADARGVGILDLPYVLYTYAVGFSLGPSTTELHVAPHAALVAAAPLVAPVAVLFAVPALAGAARLVATRAGSLVIAWLVLPLAAGLLSALATGNPLNPRYAVIAYPALVIVLGTGVWRLGALAPRHARAVTTGTLVALLLVSAWSIRNLATDPRYAKEDCRALGAFLEREARAGDFVLVSAHYMAVAVRYYYAGPADVFGYNPDDAGGRERAAEEVRRLVAGRARVWLVETRAFHGDRDGVLPSMLASTMDRDTAAAFPGIAVERFVARSGH